MRVRIRGECFSSGEHPTGRAAGPVVAKALTRSDRGTDADVELFGRFTSGPSSFHEANDPHSQLTRTRSMHWSTLRRINALDSLLSQTLGIPIHSARDVL